jgi:hypothetical protein
VARRCAELRRDLKRQESALPRLGLDHRGDRTPSRADTAHAKHCRLQRSLRSHPALIARSSSRLSPRLTPLLPHCCKHHALWPAGYPQRPLIAPAPHHYRLHCLGDRRPRRPASQEEHSKQRCRRQSRRR